MFCKLQLFENHQLVTDVTVIKAMILISFQIIEDWKYVAQVLDRLFLWIFTVAVLVGTAGIIFQVWLSSSIETPQPQTVLYLFLLILKHSQTILAKVLGISSKQHFVTRTALLTEVETQFEFIIIFG